MTSYFLGAILEAQGNQGIPDGNQKPGVPLLLKPSRKCTFRRAIQS